MQEATQALSNFAEKLAALEQLSKLEERALRGGKSRLAAHAGSFEKRLSKRRKADRVAKLARRRNRR